MSDAPNQQEPDSIESQGFGRDPVHGQVVDHNKPSSLAQADVDRLIGFFESQAEFDFESRTPELTQEQVDRHLDNESKDLFNRRLELENERISLENERRALEQKPSPGETLRDREHARWFNFGVILLLLITLTLLYLVGPKEHSQLVLQTFAMLLTGLVGFYAGRNQRDKPGS